MRRVTFVLNGSQFGSGSSGFAPSGASPESEPFTSSLTSPPAMTHCT